MKDTALKMKRPPLVWDNAHSASHLTGQTLHLIGFECESTACFRKGTQKGPNAIRMASQHIETYSPYLDRDTSDVSLADLGNLPEDWHLGSDCFVSMAQGQIREGGDWHEKGAKFLILGGEHSISYAPIKTHLEKFPNLLLLHLDAHADLRESYQEFKYSHACIIRRIFDHFGPHHRLVQYGIRSGTREEYRWMEEKKTLKKSLEDLLAFLKQVPDQRPIYLTLDLDYFDPCYLPGTGTPEPGGETFHSFVSLIKVLKAKRFVGADVVELSPDLDSSGNSSIFAAKVVRELILALTFSEAYQRPR